MAVRKWRKSHTKSVNLSLNSETDKDIIVFLETKKPKQKYIRSLIRSDMERERNKKPTD